MSILVPIDGGATIVEVPYDEVPEECESIISLLQGEKADIDIWLEFGAIYNRRGLKEQFEKLLSAAIDTGKAPGDQKGSPEKAE